MLTHSLRPHYFATFAPSLDEADRGRSPFLLCLVDKVTVRYANELSKTDKWPVLSR